MNLLFKKIFSNHMKLFKDDYLYFTHGQLNAEIKDNCTENLVHN